MNWVEPQSGTTNTLYGIGYGNGQFVAVGGRYRDTPGFTTFLKDGTILTSTNGVNWVLRPSGATNGFRGIAYGNGQFVAVGGTGGAPGGCGTVVIFPRVGGWAQRV